MFLGDSSLLHHLPGLCSLTFKKCGDLITSSTEIIQALSSIQSLCFTYCEGMLSLPEFLGDITSLRELTIQSCMEWNLCCKAWTNSATCAISIFWTAQVWEGGVKQRRTKRSSLTYSQNMSKPVLCKACLLNCVQYPTSLLLPPAIVVFYNSELFNHLKCNRG
jgi:hypothetical protein